MSDIRMFPITEERFNELILPIIESNYIWRGRPPKVSHYNVFCAILYALRTCCPWRDLPKEFGDWHVIYNRFDRGSESGLWWKILTKLQARKEISLDIAILDSTTFKVHRHGGGQKKIHPNKG